ncbi:MAG TPA: thymidine phosphorylase family protein [Rudaea sp.]
MNEAATSTVRVRRIGIDTYLEPVAYLRADAPVCRSEGFESQSRVELRSQNRMVVATLNVVATASLTPLAIDEAGLSESAWRALGAADGDSIIIAHAAPTDSFSHVRAKIFGRAFDRETLRPVIADIVSGRYSNIEMATFLTACAGDHLDRDETVALTRTMVEVGSRLSWPKRPVMDKHCIGGLPGNRTSLLVVPIVAALGVTIPKTASRAITSPAGTADTMETLAPVALDARAIRRVVEGEGGCIVWGGAVNLSPADDILIRVERVIDLDSDAQLVASVLSKKVAVGSTHVLIDIPVGPTAKIRSRAAASKLSERLVGVGTALGLAVDPLVSDGRQPIGRGIGPALEARDVLAVLRNEAHAPDDLREHALALAARLLESAGVAGPGEGIVLARHALADGSAWRKFEAIADAQGGLRMPGVAAYRHSIAVPRAGIVTAIDCRRLSRIAKLAGAPRAPVAGLDLHVRLGARVDAGQPLYTLHADSPGELAYALAYAEHQDDVIALAPA